MENYEEKLAEVREIFKGDRFATENGMVIDEIGDHYAKCSVQLSDVHRNAMGGVMGGVHFTLADFAFAVASNWQHMGTVALSTDIAFIGAVKGDSLTAVAELVKDGRSVNCYHITVKDNLGNIVADVKTVGFHKC
ncbi:MAG: PaaI family thioesterase [Ruminococcus flavefaciens]|nr:PaaI family thioesterase [Ruminococcus flavefaciens]MCM1230540.1 PaaI family thioesterase [Ruminococcus flavefaciens]